VWPCFLVAVVRPASHAVRQKKRKKSSLQASPQLQLRSPSPPPREQRGWPRHWRPRRRFLIRLPLPRLLSPRSSSSPDPRIVFCLSQLRHCLPRCTSRVSLLASIVPPWLPIALVLSQIRCASALIALLLLSCYLISFSSSTAYLLTAASSLHLPWRQHQLMRRQSRLAAVYLDAPVGLAGSYVQDLGWT
jgi:hypothetical protein